MRWLRQFARTANQDALRLDREIDVRSPDARKIDTDANALLAPVSIDGRLPGVRRELKLRTRQLVSDVVQRAVEPAQFNAADRIHFKNDLPLNKLRGRRAPRVPLSRYRVQTARSHAATTLNCSMSILRRRVLARFAR